MAPASWTDGPRDDGGNSMAVFPFVLDSRWPCGEGAGSLSLLTTPLASTTLLSHVQAVVASVTREPIMVVSPPDVDGEYDERVVVAAAPYVKGVVPASRMADIVRGYEPSDALLLLNPLCYPMEGFALAALSALAGKGETYAMVRHLVALDVQGSGTKELAMLDPEGQVQRIQRYYDGLTWLNTQGVACSLVPVSCARLADSRAFGSLPELRRALAVLGVPCQDMPLQGEVLDLGQAHGLLHLSERAVLAEIVRPLGPTQTALAHDVRVGQGCRIDPTARLYGPLIVQDNVVIEAGAAVIGPALLGAGSRIGARAIVAQCLIGRDVSVREGAAERHRVVGVTGQQDAALERDRAAPSTDRHVCAALAGPVAARSVPGDGTSKRRYLGVKRVIDTVVALLGLVFLSPLWLLVAAAIKLSSRGPVLFGHLREGKDGKVFRCWKFRTMVRDAHLHQREFYGQNVVDGPQFKLAHDPRITWVGQRLRTSNIDEIPQLLNVLCGEMSLIGPRPSPFRENQICVPWRLARLSVRPGITGLWQVCRHDRAHGDFHQWIHYDMLYVRRRSWWLDVKILLATLLTFGGRWGVPLSWLIPQAKLHPEFDLTSSVSWAPTSWRVSIESRSDVRASTAGSY